MAALVLLGCERDKAAPAPEAAARPVVVAQAQTPPAPGPAMDRRHHQHPPPLPVCRSDGEPLADARRYYDRGRYEEALACAAQASAFFPDDPQAYSERGAALAAMGRADEAKLAYARALAMDPEHLDALLGAAHLYAVSLPSSRDHDELALIYSERGLGLAEDQGQRDLQIQFALLSAMAQNDLGQSHEALERANEVLRLDPARKDAGFESAVALFELCRFTEAKLLFQRLLEDPEHGAHAHHHLGLLLEREQKWEDAEKAFTRARKLKPEDFPAPQPISKEAFRAEVQKALAELPADMRKDLKPVAVVTEEIPAVEDLTSGTPPLSPTILGLFRGPPMGENCPKGGASCRSVVLYRRNLARAVRSHEELLEQIRVTLLHEVGHLRGEDDFELAARGLE